MKSHKHKGYGKYHSVTQIHKDKQVQKWHNESLKKEDKKTEKVIKQPVKDLKHFFRKSEMNTQLEQFINKKKKIDDLCVEEKETIPQTFPVDEEGYICLDLDTTNVTGLRLMFTRTETKNGKDIKRTVNLQFENLPARDCRSNERLTKQRISLNKTY